MQYQRYINHHQHKIGQFTRALCVLVVIGLLDVHLVMMQGWAWVSMLNDRIPEQGIEQAFDTTFSGEFPCEKCRALAEVKAKESERRSDSPQLPFRDSKQNLKLIGVVSSAAPVRIFSPECMRIPFLATHLRAPNDYVVAVPSPPPQVV